MNLHSSPLPDFPKTEPQFFVSLKNKKEEFKLADPKALRASLSLMDMEAALRGAASHWGGPSAFVEILSSLYAQIFYLSKKDPKKASSLFHIINDAGHCENASYALKACYKMAGVDFEDLKKFRTLESPLTGHGEVHVFPRGVYLSNGPLASTLSQAQGLAMAEKLKQSEKITCLLVSDGALMEGEAKEALSSIPGFYEKNKLNPFILLVSDNNTKLTGRISEDSYSMQPYLKSLKALGWDLSVVEKGNDLKETFLKIGEAIKKAPNSPPQALIFKTCKGKGVKTTEESSSGGHGWPLKDPTLLPDFLKEIYGKDQVPKLFETWTKEIIEKSKVKKTNKEEVPMMKAQKGISQALIEAKEKGLPICSLSSDLQGSTGVLDFRKKFPESSFDFGVAESSMISSAVGFSKLGFLPVVDTFSQFAVTKGALPFIMASLSQAPVIGIFSHIGFQDAADGASHQALSYFAKTCSLPNTQVFALSSKKEAYELLTEVLFDFYEKRKKGEVPKSSIFFLGRENFPESYTKEKAKTNKAQVLVSSDKKESPVLIVSAGPLIFEALEATKELKKEGKSVCLINSPRVSHPDIETISHYLEICGGRLVTVEEHQIHGGLSSILVLALKEKGHQINKLKALAVRGGFGRSASKARDLYETFHLDRKSIKKACLDLSMD